MLISKNILFGTLGAIALMLSITALRSNCAYAAAPAEQASKSGSASNERAKQPGSALSKNSENRSTTTHEQTDSSQSTRAVERGAPTHEQTGSSHGDHVEQVGSSTIEQ